MMLDAELPDVVPVIPATLGTDHEQVVPVGTIFPEPLLGVTVNAEFEHMVCEILLIVGVRSVFTVTSTLNGEPLHVPMGEMGVTI